MAPPSVATAAAAGLVLLLTALTSCSGRGGPDPLTELRDRPSYEAASATYTQMFDEIQDAISTVGPDLTWEPRPRGFMRGCNAPYDRLGGVGGALASVTVPGGIPDQIWPEAFAAARDVAARYGLTDVVVNVDQPGRHDLRFASPTMDGTYASLGTDVNASLDVTTGCNLPEAVLRSAAPTT